jgi:rubredoxin
MRCGHCSLCGHVYDLYPLPDYADIGVTAMRERIEKGCPQCGATGRYQQIINPDRPLTELEKAREETGAV